MVTELSDDELRARLLPRGLPERDVEAIIAERDSAEGTQRIVEELGL